MRDFFVIICGIMIEPHHKFDPPDYLTSKPRLMNLSKIFWHLLTIVVFTFICYCLTNSIADGNIMGVVLATVSLAATIMFLWLLPKLYQQPNEEEGSET